MPDLVQRQYFALSEKYCSQGFRPSDLSCSFTDLHAYLGNLIPTTFIWAHGISWCSELLLRPPYQGNLEVTFIHSDPLHSYPYALTLALASNFKVNISVEVFCLGLPQSWHKPHICADTTDTYQWVIRWVKQKMGSWHFLQL